MALSLLIAACSNNNNNTPPATPTCTVTAAAATTSFAAAGGSGSAAVTAGSGCAWTATSGASFITISAGASGTGNGTVNFTVAANTGAARSGNLTIGSSTITISQTAAAVNPTGTLAAPTPNSPIGGATVNVARPTLVVNNAAATGSPGTITYRFEVSDQPSFPNDPVRTFTADGVAQGSGGTTSWQLTRDLGTDVLWYWHARATNGSNITSDYSATETFRTPTTCTFALSPSSLNINSTSATATITVTTGANCSWTATSNASFISILSGAAGTGTGSVFIGVPDNPGPARTGTVTIGGQTFTLSQSGASVSASFQLFDPGTSGSATTECRIRSGSVPPIASTCTLQSNSQPIGTAAITTYSWQVQYTYGSGGVSLVQTGSSPTFSFQDTCGKTGSSDTGATTPLLVILTVTDSAGNTATVSSGSGSQPPLSLRTFTCGL